MNKPASSYRIDMISSRLQAALSVIDLSIVDESHKHEGHAGAADGRGHFALTICAHDFDKLSPIKRHRLIYEALGDLLETDIHALRINARSSQEAVINDS